MTTPTISVRLAPSKKAVSIADRINAIQTDGAVHMIRSFVDHVHAVVTVRATEELDEIFILTLEEARAMQDAAFILAHGAQPGSRIARVQYYIASEAIDALTGRGSG